MAEPEPIAVDLVNASELTRLRQGVRTAKQMEAEAKETPKAEPAKKEAPKPTPGRRGPATARPSRLRRRRRSPRRKSRRKRSRPRRSRWRRRPLPRAGTRGAEEARRHAEGAGAQGRGGEEARGAEEGRRAEAPRGGAGSRPSSRSSRRRPRRRGKPSSRRRRRRRRSARRPRPRRSSTPRRSRRCSTRCRTRGRPTPSVPLDEQAKNVKGPRLGAPEGRDKQLSASEIAILAQIIRSCVQSKWNVMGGGEGAQQTIVKLRLRFNADGTPGDRSGGHEPAVDAELPRRAPTARSGPRRPASPIPCRPPSTRCGKTLC